MRISVECGWRGTTCVNKQVLACYGNTSHGSLLSFEVFGLDPTQSPLEGP
jgi:hypothetical protein